MKRENDMKTRLNAFCGGVFIAMGCLLATAFAQHDHHGSSNMETAARTSIEGVIISDAWVRLNQMTGRPSAGYFSLRNNTGTTLTLTGVQVGGLSAPHGRAMLHQTTAVDGRMKMSHVAMVTIEPDTGVDFAPGGFHIMLHNLPADLSIGGMLQLDLLLQLGTDAAVSLRVPFKLCGLASAMGC